MKAQNAVLQDFEHLNDVMRRVFETVRDPAALQCEQTYRAQVDRDATASRERQTKVVTERGRQVMEQLHTHDLDALTNEEAHLITLSWQIVPVS